VKIGSSYTIKIGEKNVSYNETFRFFLTTTLPNPHYTPETSVKVTILNFAITPQGLEEQMLNLLVQLELPELQEKKN
jgi:dynein heavy chain